MELSSLLKAVMLRVSHSLVEHSSAKELGRVHVQGGSVIGDLGECRVLESCKVIVSVAWSVL